MTSWNPDHEICLSDSDDDDSYLKPTYFGREAVIFVVDANLSTQSDHLINAFDIIRSAFLSGLLIDDKDLMALVFANTEETPEPFEESCMENIEPTEHHAVFLPPRPLTKAIVDHYLHFVQTAPESFNELYGVVRNDTDARFSHMLRLCLDLVRHCNYGLDYTTIVYITNNNCPHAVDSEPYNQALYKATDLRDKEVDFKLIPMGDTFDYEPFYREFLSLVRDEDMENFEPVNSEKLREMLADRKFKQSFNRRALGHFKFSLGPDVSMSVQYFNYFQKTKGPRKVLLQRTDNAIVKKHRLTMVCQKDPETDEVLNTRTVNITNAWYEVRLGDQSIRLSYAQVCRVRNLHAPGMMLLGFKPITELNKIHYCKPCHFMYPDERYIVGSKRLFRALWERCRVRNKFAICLFMSRKKSMPRYVALLPVSRDDAEPNSYYSLITNDGFKIVYIPFSMNVRRLDFGEWNSIANHASDEGVAICEQLIRKLRLPFNPSTLSDPVLDQLQSKLLALAFNVEFEIAGSEYFPDIRKQDERLKEIIPEFKRIFGDDDEKLATKRAFKKTTDDASCAPSKKMPKFDLNKEIVLQLIADKSLNSFTKDQLMEVLEVHLGQKISKTTKKAKLLEILYGTETF